MGEVLETISILNKEGEKGEKEGLTTSIDHLTYWILAYTGTLVSKSM